MSDKLVRVNIRIPKEIHDYYKELSDETGYSMSVLMRMDMERSINWEKMKPVNMDDVYPSTKVV